MKLTTKSEYGLLILIYLARNGATPDSGTFLRLMEICQRHDLSIKYAEQLVSSLKQANLVIARRGASGGYQLSKKPNQISMAQVVRLMDGALAPTGSVSKYFPSQTVLDKETKVISVMKDIRDYIARTMEQTTLLDLI